MTRFLFTAAAITGAVAILWMGGRFLSGDSFALGITVVIGAVYLLGLTELLRFRRGTQSLVAALPHSAEGSEELAPWLSRLDESLRHSVRLRIEGERLPLPAPVITPYLVGLLVMLGLLGTFVGMVDTLGGAVSALQGSTELAAIRSGLTAPIQGLGVAFGTSVAGIAASAMLGLNSTLVRRERMLASRDLDRVIGGDLRQHSLAFNRQQTYRALQAQAEALPAVAERLAQLATQMETMGSHLNDSLQNNQQQFNDAVSRRYEALADSVARTLEDSLAASGRLAGEAIVPVVSGIMEQIAEQNRAASETLTAGTERQLTAVDEHVAKTSTGLESALQRIEQAAADTQASLLSSASSEFGQLAGRMDQRAGELSQALTQGLQQQRELDEAVITRVEAMAAELRSQFEGAGETLQQRVGDAASAWLAQQSEAQAQQRQQWQEVLEQGQLHAADTLAELKARIAALLAESEALVQARIESEQQWNAGHGERLDALARSLEAQLGQLAAQEQARGEAAVAQLKDLQGVAAEHLAQLGRSLEEPMSRLIETASETPKAAAEVIADLRGEMSRNLERDNEMLEERREILQDLAQLSASLQDASSAQQEAVQSLLQGSDAMLREVASQFSEHIGSETGRITDLADQFATSAADIASLGDAFAGAVGTYADANTTLVEHLGRIEEALQQSTERSDEQMAYYVAQAREIIDQSMLSQKEIIDQFRRAGRTEPAASEAG